jgi:hypothetical protein
LTPTHASTRRIENLVGKVVNTFGQKKIRVAPQEKCGSRAAEPWQ